MKAGRPSTATGRNAATGRVIIELANWSFACQQVDVVARKRDFDAWRAKMAPGGKTASAALRGRLAAGFLVTATAAILAGSPFRHVAGVIESSPFDPRTPTDPTTFLGFGSINHA